MEYDQTSEYPKFGSIPRLFREAIITEKIDGTNGLIEVSEDGSVRAGSRSRWLTPGKTTDNYGFAAWVKDNESALRELGVGRHYGEWWGQGIQRGYGLRDRRFSLFNASKWGDPAVRPSCCDVVPILRRGDVFDTWLIDDELMALEINGSSAAPGFMDPEGIVVFHVKSGHLYKATLSGDGHKGAAA